MNINERVENFKPGLKKLFFYRIKQCSTCKELKLKTEFNKRKRNKDGLQNYCKVCKKAAHEKTSKLEKTIERNHEKMIDCTYEEMIDIPTWKVCSVCKELKLKTEFNKRERNKDGLQTYCRVCKNL